MTEWKIIGVHWMFGAHKTLTSVSLILDDLRNWDIVFTNIKFNMNYVDASRRNNLYYFDDLHVLYDILNFAGIFAQNVSNYNENAALYNKPFYSRYARPKIKIYFDEMGIFANSSDYAQFHKEIGKDLTQFLLQIRKLFVDIVFIIQKPEKLVKELRSYVWYWLKPEPIFPKLEQRFLFKFLQNTKKIYLEYRDEDWVLIMDERLAVSTSGDYINYKVPLKFHYKYIKWTKYYYRFYDDLFLNLKISLNLKTTYLKDSGFLKNLYYSKINNVFLFNNKFIYDEVVKSTHTVDEISRISDVVYPQPSIRSNFFHYFVHTMYKIKATRLYRFFFSFWFMVFFLVYCFFIALLHF